MFEDKKKCHECIVKSVLGCVLYGMWCVCFCVIRVVTKKKTKKKCCFKNHVKTKVPTKMLSELVNFNKTLDMNRSSKCKQQYPFNFL